MVDKFTNFTTKCSQILFNEKGREQLFQIGKTRMAKSFVP